MLLQQWQGGIVHTKDKNLSNSRKKHSIYRHRLIMNKSSANEELYEDKCAQCGRTQNSHLNLSNEIFKVHVPCSHKFCSSCIDRELSKKRHFACPRCKQNGVTIMVKKEKVNNK